jgi:hypothetical protein
MKAGGRLEAAAPGFHQQASQGEAATGLIRAQTGPVAVLDGGSGCGIQSLCSLIVVIAANLVSNS